MTEVPDTVADAVAMLTAQGYSEDFNLAGPALACTTCTSTHEPQLGIIERQYRFEGASDPEDEAIVLGVRCPACGARGVVVSAYGPDADPAVFAWLAKES